MDLGIRGRVAMVAAGTKGIGLAAARELLAEGCLVSFCGRTRTAGELVQQSLGPRARYFAADVSVPQDLEFWHRRTLEAFGQPSILVTNTGGPPAGPWTEVSDQQWQAGFESTLLNVVRLVRLVEPEMRRAGWGRIIHVTSLVAREPTKLLPISSTLRAGLAALTRLQSDELAPHGVTVNAVLPGHTLTDRQRHLAEVRAEREGITPDEALAITARAMPIGRLVQPDEVGSAIAYLCSKQAAAITGTSILVDGGMVRSPG